MSVQRPVLEFCLVVCRVGSFSCTPRASMCVGRVRGVSLTRPVMESVCSAGSAFSSCWNLSGRRSGGKFLLHALCWNLSRRFVGWGVCHVVKRVGSFYTHPRAGICLVFRACGEFLYTRPVQVIFLCRSAGRRACFLHAPSCKLSRS